MDFQQIRNCADNSIRRALGFTAIAIFTFMVGLSGEPYLAIRAGAILVTATAVTLFVRGRNAPGRNYRRTEVWLMIRDEPAIPVDRMQRWIGGALAESYFWHARIAAYLALAMWSIALIMRIALNL